MKRVVKLVAALLFCLPLAGGTGTGGWHDADGGTGAVPRTPIIAEILGAPENFVGKRVEIYGLVVAIREEGRKFMLQDVSEMPLLIVSPAGLEAAEGRQLMVSGIVQQTLGGLQVASDNFWPVKVLAGGGCC